MFDTAAAHSELDTIHQVQNALLEALRKEQTKGPQAISAALNSSISQLYKLAVFVHENFNSPIGGSHTTPSSKALFHDVRASFQQVEQVTTGTLDEISSIKDKTIDLNSTKVATLQQNVQEAKQSTDLNLKNLETRIAQASEAVDTWGKQVETCKETLQEAEEKLQQDREAQRDANIGLSILIPWWGIAGLIDHKLSPGNVLVDVGAQQQALQDAYNTFVSVRNNLLQAKKEQSDCINDQKQFDSLLEQLGDLALALSQTAKNIDSMSEAIGKLRLRAIQAVQVADEMYNNAVIASGDAFFINEFVKPILEICDQTVVEPNVAPKLEAILDELRQAYGRNNIPEELATKFDEIQAKVKRFIPKSSEQK
ncbi:hypothetical protein McanMca71_000815 [Microsporum canis]|uniref:Uncharacterized protein n=1 Tax=Arthroderma otae (strain ATCC MYA-4605 / CBS 113480) TaxID=554155 RepID=C5FIP9_ARTOC|nr:conserved hypothetical protein [Microsporum canis CBS 113480]EEQ29140.1 conserved hypothetical protein [Microsporum canis CBS 113480]